MGKEFDNKSMKSFLKKMKIKFHVTVSENKASVVEIAQKNIQRRVYAFMMQNETLSFIEILPHSVNAYNNSYHRILEMTPEQAKNDMNYQKIQLINLQRLHKLKKVKIKPRFQLGDIVSLDKKKNLYARSYNLQNSYAKYEIYKISTRNTTYPKYYLKHVDSDQKIKNGYFYFWQLTLCTTQTFRGSVIKQRIRRGKKEFLFKYKGYPDEFSEWKQEKDISSLAPGTLSL